MTMEWFLHNVMWRAHPGPFTYTLTHFLNWKWNAAVFPSADRISPLACHQRNIPRLLLLAGVHSQLTEREGDCRETDERGSMRDGDSASLWRTLPPHAICGWKRSYAMSWKISMWLNVNKSAGGIVFVSPAPSLPGPEGKHFHVDSRAVCPDVGLLDMKSPQRNTELYPISSLDFVEWALTWAEKCFFSSLFFLCRDPRGNPVH